jgi:O-antigen/teichoic acid export membrane protein
MKAGKELDSGHKAKSKVKLMLFERKHRSASSSSHSESGRAVMNTTISRLAILFINAATGVITARALKPVGRGELAAMVLWPTFLSFVTTLGIPSSIIYLLRKHSDDEAKNIVNGLAMTLVLGVLACFGGATALPFWLRHQYSPTIIFYAQMFLLVTPLLSLTLTGRAVIEAKGLFNYSNQILLLYPATTLAGLLVLLGTHMLSPVTASLAYAFNAFPSFILMVYRIVPLVEGRWKVEVKACRRMLHYGVRSYGVDLLGTLALQVDQVIVVSLLSAPQMGIYGVLLSLSRMFNVFQTSIVTILFPKASGHPPEVVLALVERSARVGTVLTGTCCLVISVVGSRVLSVLYGREYAHNDRCLQVLLLEMTLSGCVFILAQAFMALGRPGVVSILQAIGLFLSVPLMLLLVPRYGILGAAESLLISTVARLIFVFFGFRIFLKMRLPAMTPRRRDFDALLALLPKPALAK